MTFLIVLVAFVLIGGIIWLNRPSPKKVRTREVALQELCQYFQGQMSILEGKDDGIKIDIDFEGYKFVFEDFREAGFVKGSFKAVVKLRVPENYSLNFVEKGEKTTIRSNIILASDIKDDPAKRALRLISPKALEKIQIVTNDTRSTNKLFENSKALKILLSYLNIDARKYPALALKINSGEIILDYQTQPNFKPNYDILMKNPSSLEDELEKMITLAQSLREACK